MVTNFTNNFDGFTLFRLTAQDRIGTIFFLVGGGGNVTWNYVLGFILFPGPHKSFVSYGSLASLGMQIKAIKASNHQNLQGPFTYAF